jgi:hypothetical protein
MHDIRTERYARPGMRLSAPSMAANGVHVTGAQLVVACAGAECSHEILVDPQPLFGARRFWPVSGRSERFRCRCGSRETRLTYTAGVVANDDPINEDAIRLWA